jgi:hypothetical protein
MAAREALRKKENQDKILLEKQHKYKRGDS